MTKGEQQLRAELGRNRTIVDINDIIYVLKSGSYFVHCGEILEVTWDNPVDWEDGKVSYSLIAEDPELEEDED